MTAFNPDATDGDWHMHSAAQALQAFGSDRHRGLADADVTERQARFGRNALAAAQGRGALWRFLLQFHNVLIYVLLVAGAVTVLLGHVVDAGVIFGVVVINAIIGFIQEGKAERALNAIRDMLPLHANVMRDGQRQEVMADTLVPGDIVFLVSGDKVPADVRLLEARNLQVEEAALTGESLAVDKDTVALGPGVTLAERACMAYSGTLVVRGQSVGLVVATGEMTEIGRISVLVDRVEVLTTPLMRQMAGFSGMLTWLILVVAVAAFAFGVLVRTYPPGDMFLAAVGLAVAAIPEGLPAIMTITLAIGVQRMARRNAIVRRLPAVEALGSVTVICTDKTGTLTCNAMTVQRVLLAEKEIAVSGVGYGPHGGFSCDDVELDPGDCPQLEHLGRAALLCNDAALVRDGERWKLAGDPTEGALLAFAAKAGLDAVFERDAWPRVDLIPFESEHRFMATLHHDHHGGALVVLKGAPERVLALCARQREAGGDQPLQGVLWRAAGERAAARGMRLLAVAVRGAEDRPDELDFADVETGGFCLLGILGLSDPPREEAVAAVARCLSAGIRVKMITGDHVSTALAIGRQVGLPASAEAMSGADIEALDDLALARAIGTVDIFARASPEHKLRLVKALQSRGEVVAMTGDGVNDAPALKRADVGVAMGLKGTEAAKEAAEMVLADDNFASVAAAVEEGRRVYDNLTKAIVYILPTNIGQGAMVLAAVLFGLTMPITAAQILWVNMITAVTLSLALAFELPEPDLMQRPPRRPGVPLLTRFVMWRIVFVGVLLVAGAMGLFLWALGRGASLEVARTVTVNAILVGEAFYLFNVRSFSRSILNRDGLLGSRHVLYAIVLLLGFQFAFTYWPVLQGLFGTAALDAGEWGRILVFGGLVLFLVEAEKRLLRTHRSDRA